MKVDFWELFGLKPEQSVESRKLGTLFTDLETLLQDRSTRDIQYVAGFSGLLGKVAYSDRDFSMEESLRVKEILEVEAQISSELCETILQVLKQHTVELVGIEDHRYLQLINAVCSKEEKIKVLRSLFSLAAANDSISFDEESSLGLIAKGLRLTHSEIVEVRREFAEKLEILKAARA